MRRSVLLAALTSLFSFAVAADYSITPSLGPAAGGTAVMIQGPFGSWPYTVYFDETPATTTRISDDTLLAIAPAHSRGVTGIYVLEDDVFYDTDVTFEFTGNALREQYLLPVLVEPVKGAFGSEFRTELRGLNTSPNQTIDLWGLEIACRFTPPVCNWLQESMVQLQPTSQASDLLDYNVFLTGTPGRFLEVPRERVEDLSLTLRVYDTSRAAENRGTEIPIVRTTEFRRKPFVLLGVPRDPRFRNTLRVYATGPTTVRVHVNDDVHTLTLPAGQHEFDPAYAQFTNFPTGNGVMRVYIEPTRNGPAVWGFITVTNNETQHITTITPR